MHNHQLLSILQSLSMELISMILDMVNLDIPKMF